jgi:hypothetical protein
MRRWALTAAGAALLLAGCSRSDQAPPDQAPSSAPSGTVQPSGAGSATTDPSPGSAASTPGGGTSPSGAPCPAGQPSGTYALEQFAGQSNSALGHGKGGDITVTFTDGSYRLKGAGKQPMAVTVSDKAAGDLYVKGAIDGSYDTSGSVRTFAVDSAKGTAYVTNDEGKAPVQFAQLAQVIGLQGEFAVACQGNRLALAGPSALFSLVRS